MKPRIMYIVMFGFAMSCLHLGLVIQRWLRQ